MSLQSRINDVVSAIGTALAAVRDTANNAVPKTSAPPDSLFYRGADGSISGYVPDPSVRAYELVLREGAGQILLPTSQTDPTHAASKSYVDAQDAGKVGTSRAVNTGTGLSGGGTLAADRTISLSAASQASLARADAALPSLVMDASTTTATINAFLAQGGYRALRGTAVLTDSLLIPSNTTLDAYGADITGSTSKNIIQNTAAVPARTVTTGASTAGSTTLTASGAAFTSSDVGRQVEVVAAGPNAGRSGAPGSWYGTVTAVNSSTSVTLSQPANLTTSGSTVYVYPARNMNIAILGGVWRPGNKNTLSQQQEGHGFRIRRVDNITISDTLVIGPGVPQMGGQYAISLGDVTRSLSTNLSFQDVNSDGIHYQGPANGIVIQNVEALNSGDDLVAFTPVDGQSYNGSRLGDTEGDIYDVVVANVTGYGVLSHLKIAGGTGPGGTLRKLTKVNVDGIFGVTKGNAPINIVDYAGVTSFSGRIANVHAVGATNTAAVITNTATNTLQLTLEDIHWPLGQGVPSTGVVNLQGTIRRAIVRNVHYAATSGASSDTCPAVYVGATSIDYLEVDGTFGADPNTLNFIGVQIASAVVMREMKVSRHYAGVGSSGNAAYFTGNNWNILSMSFDSVNRYTGSLIDGTGTSANSSDITATNCHNGSAWFLLRQPANVNISSCSQTTDRTSGAGIRLYGTNASLVLSVSGSNRGSNNLISRDGTGTQSVRVLECLCIPIADNTVTAAGNGDIYASSTQSSLRLRASNAWKTL